MQLSLDLLNELTDLDDAIALSYIGSTAKYWDRGMDTVLYKSGLKRSLVWRQEAIRAMVHRQEEINSIDVHLFLVETKDILERFTK